MFETKFSRHARKIFYLSACVSIAALTLWFGANLNVSSANPGLNPAVKNDFDGDRTADFAILRDPAAFASNNNLRMKNHLTAKRGARSKSLASARLSARLSPNDVGADSLWAIRNSRDGSATFRNFGQSTDRIDLPVPSDYDGDGKTDIAIWRAEAESGPNGAFFYVLNSFTNTITTTDFGVDGDNPSVVGDYDGDGKADLAVYRCPLDIFGQCFYFYKGSLNNPNGNITYVPWGDNTDFDIIPNPGDFDGDGKFDFCVRLARSDDPNESQFVLLKSFDGGVEYINWGTEDAAIAPGDYDGDGMNDFMVVNNVNGKFRWSLLTRTGNQSYTQWGLSFSNDVSFDEFIAQSDYDGDGKTDIAVWRRDNNDFDNCYYYILRSRDGTFQAYEWGASTDVPVNGWDVNTLQTVF